ncbi:hypothetical protein [Paracoccus sp. S1E-3]|uniref:hypothetical protein n=2 Tax=Paracoccus TaxID=265 RepID=UPI0015EFA159|nr:hypothetical protein [Paracoccus sp. S1E-3]MBA4490446.1 hypothetical protein [Paracoccus sp. S1E-3]
MFGAAFLLAIPVILLNTQKTMGETMTENKRRVVSVAIMQPVNEFLAQQTMAYYRDQARGEDYTDHSPFYLTEFASDEKRSPTMTGGPIILRYASPRCGFDLPAGRQFMAGMYGPVIDSASLIFPMEPMSWDEMQVMMRDIVTTFDTAGWARTGRKIPGTITPEDFGTDTGPKQALVGQWTECNDGPAFAEVTIQHYNSQSSGSFIPPAVLSPPIGDDAEDRFLIYASFSVASAELRKSIGALAMARREAEGIDPAYENLPARIWLDDPDWRPAGWVGGF